MFHTRYAVSRIHFITVLDLYRPLPSCCLKCFLFVFVLFLSFIFGVFLHGFVSPDFLVGFNSLFLPFFGISIQFFCYLRFGCLLTLYSSIYIANILLVYVFFVLLYRCFFIVSHDYFSSQFATLSVFYSSFFFYLNLIVILLPVFSFIFWIF